MENLIIECHNGRIPAQAVVVISDNPQAGAIAKARNYGVPVEIVDRKGFPGKMEFEAAIAKHLDCYQVDYGVLAGFMRILSPEFVRRYQGKIINIHPSLLPAFPGAHGIRDAFKAKAKETGVTVHFVNESVDGGPVILRQKVVIDSGDTLETLEKKIHAVEYQLFPEALRRVLNRRGGF